MSGEEMNDQTIEGLDQEREKRALDMRVIAALERAPDVAALIPSDFAARVAAAVPARRTIGVSATHYGRSVMWGCLAVLLVALVVVAAKGLNTESAVGATLEWTLFTQFLAIAVWLGVKRWKAN